MNKPHSAFMCCVNDILSWDKEDLKNFIKLVPQGTFNYNKHVNSLAVRSGTVYDIGDYLFQLPYLKMFFAPLSVLLILILLLIADIILFSIYYFKKVFN